MVETVKNFILEVFGDCAWLGIIIIAMIPLIELRGAIPFALSSVWGASKLSTLNTYLCSVLGATIPALIILPCLIPVFNWMKKTKFFRNIANHFDKKFESKTKKIEKNAAILSGRRRELKKFWGVVAFVAVPLPLTGAWTGSAVAAYLNLNYFKGVFAVFLGNLISGAIMMALCLLFPKFVDYILYAFLILVVVFLLVVACISLFRPKKIENDKQL